MCSIMCHYISEYCTDMKCQIGETVIQVNHCSYLKRRGHSFTKQSTALGHSVSIGSIAPTLIV